MSRLCVLFISLCLLCTISCEHQEQDWGAVAKQSEQFRLLLVKYYRAKGQFPNDPNLLKEFDPGFRLDGGGLWNRWNYTAWDPGEYNIWTYPGRTRRSLWFKFNVESPSETGWFVSNDDGRFQRKEIPLLKEEEDLLKEAAH